MARLCADSARPATQRREDAGRLPGGRRKAERGQSIGFEQAEFCLLHSVYEMISGKAAGKTRRMNRSGILLKIATPGEGKLPEARLGATGIRVGLRPLLTVAAAAPGEALAAAPGRHTWYAAEAEGPEAFGAGSAHPWDLAHAALADGLGVAGAEVAAAEPDLEQGWTWRGSEADPFAAAAPAAEVCKPDGQKGEPYDEGPGFGWHLEEAYSTLRAARDRVGEAQKGIVIAHLDTGYDKEHAALPENLAGEELQRNFVEGGNSAVDQTPSSGLLVNRGHGTGTLGILAGGMADPLISGESIPQGFGPLGGAPLARVVPVRIANSVVHFSTSSVAQGIDYARQIGADVLSMSMGGLPSAAWADAVNAAYEAGLVLVCAAGNNFSGLPTSLIVYPARFQRVIAACGVMAGYHPYYGLGGPMEGNVGPASKMATAMAAFTPNIPWLRLGCPRVVDADGGGTSSATPQIAAAAALWLAEHGGGYARGWQRVEAVRAALFGAARGNHAEPDKYFGQGVLQARGALDRVPEAATLKPTERDSASFAFLHLLTSAFGIAAAEPRQLDMLNLELTQLALNSRAAQEAVPDPGLPPERIPAGARRRFLEAILDERLCSMTLRGHLERLLGRGVSGATLPPAAAPAPAQFSGADIRRKPPVLRPASRPLRVFATDPDDSARLATSFVNIATISVPWERVRPGPVGEYLEVVDIDPASGAAYDPVDLEDPRLMAQDGHAPSEGNPQFHQQMVYAVAMRTIRNFEIALGRRALWAERRLHSAEGAFQPAPDGGYVQRLRIYPHALRARNAYYSPERAALLFGYFVDQGAAGPPRTVFTCLSHDIVAHETTHALLDGLHRRYQEATNPDVLAFHEAFADIVAIFQHFTFPELLRYEIGRLQGDLGKVSMLSDLARQFGQALHNGPALRRAIDPDAGAAGKPLRTYRDAVEPHERGALLLASVFDAFVALYTRRTEDLYRLATGGTGILRPGAIHPDLVARLAEAAAETAQRILTICIRALDYMPPVSPTFGAYLRSIVTADADLAPDHGLGYRVAFAEAFLKRGIYPEDISSVSPDSLLWQAPDGPVQSTRLNDFIRSLDLGSYTQSDRRQAFLSAKRNAAQLHDWLARNLDAGMADSLGLDFRPGRNGARPRFEVHSVRPARRTTAEGEPRTDVVAVITQRRELPLDPGRPDGPAFTFRGGCTLLLDREYDTDPIRYAITHPIWSTTRAERERRYIAQRGLGPNAFYGQAEPGAPAAEPFAAFHAGLQRG